MIPFILTMIISLSTGVTSFSVEYHSGETCEAAKQLTRERIASGSIVLLTCTRK